MKKLNTDHVYRQRKYNMLHEMSEGFSKAVTLCSHLCLQIPPVSSQLLHELVGTFDIDPFSCGVEYSRIPTLGLSHV